jgi:hypothetical protein
LYGSYRLAGLWGPIEMFALFIFGTFVLVYLNMRRRNANRVLTLFVLAAAFMASSASWGPRIQMISLFFLAAYALILQRFDDTRDRRLLVAFPLLMLLWANIHGGFALGLALLGINLAGEGLNHLTHREGAFSRDDLRYLAIALAVTFAVTMVNPNGVRQLLYPLTFILPNAYTNLIEESASPNFHMPVMMVFEAMLLTMIAAFFIGMSKARRPQINWTHLLMVLAFTHLAFSQVRNVPIWAVLISPIVLQYLRDLSPRLEYRPKRLAGGIMTVFNIIILALVLLVYAAETAHFVTPKTLAQAEVQNYPKGAVAYMQSHHLPPRVFVSYGWGGYLLWHLFPQYRDYMDSRADTLYNNRILQGYLDMYAAHPDWSQMLDRNRVQDVLVEPTAPLSQVLAESKGWKLVYKDSTAVLYTRS